jgi:hypothetical protein
MKKPASSEVKRGQAISFRIPSDTPEHILKHIQKLKETERRNFSSKIAEFVLDGVSNSYTRERETITIPLPQKLTKAQRDWLKHEHSEALLGNIIYQLISDPIRSTSILASFNSKSVNIDEALYLQETDIENPFKLEEAAAEEELSAVNLDDLDDDLGNFDWETAKKTEPIEKEEEKEEDVDDLLGGFLASMNK